MVMFFFFSNSDSHSSFFGLERSHVIEKSTNDEFLLRSNQRYVFTLVYLQKGAEKELKLIFQEVKE